VTVVKDAMTLKEASTYLTLDEGIVTRLAEERRIPAVRIDDQWLFSRKSLEKWRRLQARRSARA
jgi:excisionase family DNA binding protein